MTTPTREQALQWAREARVMTGNDEEWSVPVVVDFRERVVSLVALAYSAGAASTSTWVRTQDHMPPADTWLLVVWGSHRVVDEAHTFTKWKHPSHPLGYLIQGHGGSHNDVTHWMLRPEPPQAPDPVQLENNYDHTNP